MDKELLKRILSQHSRVIIPSFGAFLRKVDNDSVIFSPFLKSDDGLVVGIVEREYGVSHSEAQDMVTEFVAHVRSVLGAKSKFYIDDLGMLLVDSNGAISFVTEKPAPVAEIQIEPTPVAPPQRLQPQPIAQPVVQAAPAQPVIPQPISRPVVSQPLQHTPQPVAQPIPAQQRAPIPQPIAQPRVGVTPPVNAGVFARPQVPSALGGEKGQPVAQNAGHIPAGGAHVATQGQPVRRPQKPVARKKRNSSNDMWLIIAIAAALIVVVILIVGLVMTSETPQFDL